MPEPARPAVDGASGRTEPLRDRRRRELREQMSDLALRMFLERGFEAVRVEDIARAVGVTKKTVFNHFPSKEALIADRWQPMRDLAAIEFRNPDRPLIDTAVAILREELDVLLTPMPDAAPSSPAQELMRFRELVESTPDLVAHERLELDRLTATIVEAVRSRSARDRDQVDDAVVLLDAAAIVALWRVFYDSIRRHLHRDPPMLESAALTSAVMNDVVSGADALRTGIR